jgi:hypothetical protein
VILALIFLIVLFLHFGLVTALQSCERGPLAFVSTNVQQLLSDCMFW